ncbi:MAG TPA: DNA alkylation repair protein [Lentimicrobium sp.]|nr:DNA alkylation repair protein [Lentimicrobium sp.]
MKTQAQNLYSELKNYCETNANDELVKKYSRYFKEGKYDAWGLSQSLMDAKKEELKKSNFLTLDLVFETAPLLMKSGKYEETSFALAMLTLLSNNFSKDVFNRLQEWFKIGITNWAHADYLGMFMLPMFLKKKLVSKEDFIPWISSQYKFQRRCVPVTFIKLLKEEPLSGLIEITDPLMKDGEREVHQGVGWYLREAWKIHPEQVEDYLLKYKDTAPRLIFQYATEKMTPEGKQRFRKSKG